MSTLKSIFKYVLCNDIIEKIENYIIKYNYNEIIKILPYKANDFIQNKRINNYYTSHPRLKKIIDNLINNNIHKIKL